MGERYFMIMGDGHIRQLSWQDTPVDADAWQFGNCFRQRQEAQRAREAMQACFQQGRCAENGTAPAMEREARIAAMKGRLRTLLPYYEHKEEHEYFYLARDADLTRAAESLVDCLAASDLSACAADQGLLPSAEASRRSCIQ
jgi:hypothetical protein